MSSQPAITIRTRTAEDMDQCVQLLKIVHAASGYPVIGTGNALGFLSSSSDLQTWVADQDGQIIGHATVGGADHNDTSVKLWLDQGRDEEIGTFKRLFVHPEKQGLGIAKLLAKACQDYASEHSIRLVLFVLYDIFPGAKRLYEKMGWIMYGASTFTPPGGKAIPVDCYVSP